jgi:AcrR family transcriptional regulator
MPTKDDTSTRDRLLEAARAAFADKGYHRATVAEICKRAGANIAAVNYYFRSKEGLYVEAWREAFARSLAAHPPDGGVAADAPPEDRLRARILAMMRRVADPKSQEIDIIHKELAAPTGLLADVMTRMIEPVREGFAAVVRDLLGQGASSRRALLCQRSITTQCIHFTLRERYHRTAAGGPRRPGGPALGLDVETIADHVYRFSLEAIRGIRRAVERGDLADRE